MELVMSAQGLSGTTIAGGPCTGSACMLSSLCKYTAVESVFAVYLLLLWLLCCNKVIVDNNLLKNSLECNERVFLNYYPI